uniref:BRCT domain-containing protein n=1 Tax=Laticauda laticaudata TaxID=8630 RepID=A0A8C5T2W0_LATLA
MSVVFNFGLTSYEGIKYFAIIYNAFCLSFGNFSEQLEWIVELCGASLVKEPHLFTNNSTAVIIIQPDAWTEEKLPLQCRIGVVSREWVLDSVSCYQCQPFNDYIIPQV